MGVPFVDGFGFDSDLNRPTNLQLDLVFDQLWNVDIYNPAFKDLKR